MPGTCGTAAAIANALFHATGRRIRDLPVALVDAASRMVRSLRGSLAA